jgi:hypothetical protein
MMGARVAGARYKKHCAAHYPYVHCAGAQHDGVEGH